MSSSDKLKEFSRHNIINALYEAEFAAAHWEKLGLQLKRPHTQITDIRADHMDVDSKLTSMITQWMAGDLGASWQSLAAALEQTVGYGPATAARLRKDVGLHGNTAPSEIRDKTITTGKWKAWMPYLLFPVIGIAIAVVWSSPQNGSSIGTFAMQFPSKVFPSHGNEERKDFKDRELRIQHPLYRYWKSGVNDHFYTTNPSEIGTVTPEQVGNHGYVSEGIQCLLFASQVSGSVPLYRYWKASVSDHFYTTNAGEIGTTTHGQTGKYGYVSEGVAGYCFPSPSFETVPLYRYWKASVSDHFYTTNPEEIGTTTHGQVGNYGYKSEGVACYVLPQYQ